LGQHLVERLVEVVVGGSVPGVGAISTARRSSSLANDAVTPSVRSAARSSAAG